MTDRVVVPVMTCRQSLDDITTCQGTSEPTPLQTSYKLAKIYTKIQYIGKSYITQFNLH